MIFNSIDFAIFLPTVFLLYWFATNNRPKAQNALLLIASYIFYGWWNWRFLSLLILSSSVDYFIGLKLSTTKKEQNRKSLLLISIFVNLGLLGLFKYFNFFLESFVEAFSIFGYSINSQGLNIILPVGISFYTFQTLSYSIDVYKQKLEPTKDIITFFLFVSFFPQLVAGPIERATNLLPQLYKKRLFRYDKVVDGMRQILWGLFKKTVIADNCARYVDIIFANHTDFSGSTLLLGVTLFAFQIYGDFSGYSDIAIGVSRLFGIDLMKNFASPYFSRNIAEFWRRWHISLSTWFRDYIYIPLGGSRDETWKKTRNIFIIFIISGFWHGANWTFIAWGALNAVYYLPLMWVNTNRKYTNTIAEGKLLPNFKELFQMGITFFITLIAWVFFRAESISQAIHYISGVFSISIFSIPEIFPKVTLLLVTVFVLIEWLQREKQHVLQFDNVAIPKAIRWSIYYTIILTITLFSGNQQQFIYFQF